MPNPKKLGIAVAMCALVAAAGAASYQYRMVSMQRPDARAVVLSDVERAGKAGDDADRALVVPRWSFMPSAGSAGKGRGSSAPRTGVVLPAPVTKVSFDEAFNQGTGVTTRASAPGQGKGGLGTYIVVFTEAPLASYKGGTYGLAAPKRATNDGRMRLDSKSREAVTYVSYLQSQQRSMESKIAATVNHELAVRQRMQHAINGIVVDLRQVDAAAIQKMPGVRLVEEYREVLQDTDVGPILIGAQPVWDGTNTNAPAAYQGEGLVAGIIDSGINFGSPSFAGTSPADGYVHVNPLGAGVYLGTCAAAGDDLGRCNDKLIGGYDFVCGAPGNTCGQANIREEPGFGDTNSHGSHTASTVAGNRRDALFAGGNRRISGVAPRANVIAYDVCYTNTSTNQGLCPNVSSVAAVNQAIADGIVDVINYSIGGGVDPWSDAVSLAFLSATDAGIYVAASAGNSGPGAGTLGHVEPWVSSTAAANHGRGAYATLLNATSPTPVPAALSPLVLVDGNAGVSLTASLPGTTPLVISAGIDTTSDGCAAYPAGTFAGAIAVIRRGTCSFVIKTDNATAAGAVAVIIANNAEAAISPTVPATTIPVFGVPLSMGNALRDFAASPAVATAQISFPGVGLPNTADALAAFSSRGPAGAYDLVKPDLTAPGVDILAAVSGITLTGSENAVGQISGTSMSSPHNAGAGALVRQARPSWTAPEIKSALMMTATPTVFLEDEVTLANPFARGSGRIRVDRAINAGLVLNETFANFTAANPGSGGNPSSLNIASMGKGSCYPTCTFTRSFRNPRSFGTLWTVALSGLPGSVSKPSMWVPAGGTTSLVITIYGDELTANGAFNFGTVQLSQRYSGNQLDSELALRLPVAVAVQPPTLSLPASASASLAPEATGSTMFNIANTGGSVLNYLVTNSGSGTTSLYNAIRGAAATGFRSATFTDSTNPQAQYAAEDFTTTTPVQLTSLTTEGFVSSNLTLPAVATNITWAVYPDAAGLPAGDPFTSPGAAAWSYTAAPNSAGVTITGGTNISLNLVAAGQTVNLPAGKYWVVVSARSTLANRWVWFVSDNAQGTYATITVTGGVGTWVSGSAFSGLNLRATGLVSCGAPWMGAATPANGALDGGGSVLTTLPLSAAGLSPGSNRGYFCVNSNDPARPTAAMPVDLTVTTPG